MFNLLFNSTSMPVLEQVMSFTEQRQNLLADNVANIDTPGYRATDLPVGEFTSALEKAIQGRAGGIPGRFVLQSTPHIDFAAGPRAQAVPVTGQMNFYDAGNRSVENVMAEMGKNALWHNVAVELFRQQSQLLETAIRERVT